MFPFNKVTDNQIEVWLLQMSLQFNDQETYKFTTDENFGEQITNIVSKICMVYEKTKYLVRSCYINGVRKSK